MNVTLIGMTRSGKSTLGVALAKLWGCDFYDLDRKIEATYACESGGSLTVREIFTQQGADTFRRVEGVVVCELFMQLNDADGTSVVAVGGRTATNEAVSSLLDGIGAVVYLRVPLPVLLQRLRQSPLPGFLHGDAAEEEFARLYQERHPVYERLAQLTVDLDGLNESESLDALAKRIEEYAHGR